MSKYVEKMKEAAARPDLHRIEFGTVYEAAARFSMSPGSVKKIAEEADAVRHIGRLTRYNLRRIGEYIDGKG